MRILVFCVQQYSYFGYGALKKFVACVTICNKSVAMASICFCIIAVVLMSSPTLSFTQLYRENDVTYTSTFDEDVKVNASVNLRTALREVDSRFVSVALDSSLVNYHWLHFDFRYGISYLCYLLL